VTGDQAYQFEVTIDIAPGATAGVLTFYNSRLYAGLGYSDSNLVMHRYGQERLFDKPPSYGHTLHLRLTNDHHIVSIECSPDGVVWERFGARMELSGYHHNVAYDFLSLRPALYAAGTGEVRFRDFKYTALGR
jgi:xylan 1,4-beta-xylosidase